MNSDNLAAIGRGAHDNLMIDALADDRPTNDGYVAPTLMQDFCTDDEVFLNWFCDALGDQDKGIPQLREAFVKAREGDVRELGYVAYRLINTYMEAASERAE